MNTPSDAVRRSLTDRLAELSARIARIEQEIRQPLQQDFAEQATEREDDEAKDALEKVALAEVGLINKVLVRLESGDYGYCATCGDAIDPERLEVLPAALQCFVCANKATAAPS